MMLAAVFSLALSAKAQTPLHSMPAPGLQSGAQLGSSVAVNGGLTVVAAPNDDIGASNSGVVKVFATQTGALLHVIPNPSPAANDLFGDSVSLDGTMLLVGAPQADSTNATDAGCAYVYDLAGVTPTVPVFTLQNPDPADGGYFGASVAISGMRVVIGAYLNDIGLINEAGSAYVYDLASLTPTQPVDTLISPNPASSGWFGRSVGISGTRVVIGAFRENIPSFSKAGSAYVFDFTNGNTPVVTTLNNPDPAAFDQFGVSVAISGMRVVVGAAGDDTNASNAGSAYVYDFTNGNTPAVTTLNNPEPAAEDSFGISVAITNSRIVVGAHRDDTGASDSGSAYVYDLENLASGSPTPPLVILQNPSPANGDGFGRAVAVSDTRVIVGAPNDDTGAMDSGSAYLYDFTNGNTPVLTTLNNPGPNPENRFGWSVAVSGTYMVVGAPQDDSANIADAGRAYLYNLAGTTPTVPAFTFQNPNPAANDQFGASVAISGTRLVVGAYLDDPGNISNAGSAYVYDLADATPTQPVATLTSPNPAIDDRFGWSVGISGMRVVIGAHLDDVDSITDAGSAYVYDLTGGTPALLATLNHPDPANNDQFGISVAVSGMRVVVGATGDDTNATNAGSAYVYDFTNGNTPAVTTLNNPYPAADDHFGVSVAISNSRMVVGAHQDDTGASNSGCAYVYDLANLAIGSPTPPLVTLQNPSPVDSDSFGSAVAISSSHALVGVPAQDTGSNNAGRAYLFNLNSQTPQVPVATLNNPSPAADDQFGSSVAITGKTCVIGVPYDDSIVSDSGAAFVFGPAAQISVEQPSGTVLPEDGAAIDYGSVFTSGNGDSLTFTIRNNGTANLNGIAVGAGGTNAGDFFLNTTSTESSLPPGAFTTFSVRFQPSAAGARTANLSITSDNGDVNPFLIAMTGTGVLPSITLEVSPSSVTEDGASNLVYSFSRSGPADSALTVAFSVAGTAAFGTDYGQTDATTFTADSGTVIIAAGNSTATVTINPEPDTAFEPDETAILTVVAGSGYAIGSPNSATGTITNDDTEVSVAVAPSSVAEDGGPNLVYTFSRSGPTDGPLTVAFNVTGTAAFGTDYTPSDAATFSAESGTVIIAAGNSTATVTINPEPDTAFEPDETAILTVAAGSGYAIGTPNSATGAISNDDTEVSVAVAPSSVAENGESNLVYTFTRSGPTDSALTVAFSVAGTAAFGTDYTPSDATTFTAESGTVIIAAGNSTANVTINPEPDTAFEPDETVILTVAAGSGYTGGTPNSASGTITNDDTLDQLVVEQPEGNVLTSGSSTVNYNSVLVGAPNIRTFVVRNMGSLPISGLAVSILGPEGPDFIASSPSSSLASGGSTSFTVTFTPSAIGGRSAILRITSDNIGDTPFQVGLTGTGSTARELFDAYVDLAGLSGPNAQPGAIPYNDGVTNLIKYAFNLNASEADVRTLIPSTGVAGLPVLLYLSNPSPTIHYEFLRRKNSGLTYKPLQSTTLTAGSWEPMTGTTTITNIDALWERVFIEQVITPEKRFFRMQVLMDESTTNPQVSVAVSPSNVTEDGSNNLVYTFNRSGPTTGVLMVSFNVSGTALFGSDYGQIGADSFGAATGSVSFAIGSSTATVTIDPNADTALETGETVILTLAAAGSYAIGSPDTATGTISNDDTPDQIVVEQPEGTALTSGVSTLNYGSSLVGVSTSRTFVIRNTGTLPINGLSVSTLGSHSIDFIASSPPSSLISGGNTSFTVTFNPSAIGSRSATLRITSDNIGDTPFEVNLTGTGSTARDLFDDYVELAGPSGANAEPSATPFSDGVTNLIKYACNMNASGPDIRTLVPGTGTAGLPVLRYLNDPAPIIRYEFLRRKNSGLTYTPWQSTMLTVGSWEPMTGTTTVSDIDARWERVVIEQAATPEKRFVRMQVVMD